MADETVTTGVYIESECPKCHGTGVDYHCWCKVCNADLTGQTWKPDSPLPCGHDGTEDWDEREDICGECEGMGKVRRAVSLQELAAMLAPIIAPMLLDIPIDPLIQWMRR